MWQRPSLSCNEEILRGSYISTFPDTSRMKQQVSGARMYLRRTNCDMLIRL
jgi:hypothetical protein